MKLKNNPGIIRKLTVSKYTNLLKSALIKVVKEPTLDAGEFCTSSHISSMFFKHAISLKYLDCSKEGKKRTYYALVDPAVITDWDGQKMAEYSSAYLNVHKENKDKELIEMEMEELRDELNALMRPCTETLHREDLIVRGATIKEFLESVKDNAVVPQKVVGALKTWDAVKLSEFTDKQLFDELKNRGFEGSLSKRVVVTLN